MNFDVLGVKVTVSYPFLAVLTVFLVMDKTGLGGRMLCAALIHELGHLLVMYLLRQPPHGIDFVSFGIRIRKQQSTKVSYWGEVAIFLAGPLLNFFFAAIITFTRGFTQLAQIHLLLGLFNLLPIGALDGGMAVQSLACCFASPRTAQSISRLISLVILLPLVTGAVFLTTQGRSNITLVVTLIYLAVTIFAQKG